MQSTENTRPFTSGQRLGCPQCDTEVIVIRVPGTPVRLACGGVGLADIGEPRNGEGHVAPEGDAVQLGKRYVDEVTGLELLCTKAGAGALTGDGHPLGFKSAKPLPSSD